LPWAKVKVQEDKMQQQHAQFVEQLQSMLQEHKDMLAKHAEAAASCSSSKSRGSVITKQASG
jgi:hypothetical protein